MGYAVKIMKSVATQLIGLATGAQTKFDFVALRNAAIEATVDGELNQATGLDADNQAVEEGADTALNAGMTTALTGRAPNLEMVVDEALVSTIEDEAIAKIHAESQSETNKTSGKGKNKLDQQRKRDQAVGKSTPKSDAARSQQSPESQERHSLKPHDKTIKELDKENKAKKQASSWKKPDAKPKTHASVVSGRTKSQAKTGYEGVASAKASQRQLVVSQRQTRMQRWGAKTSSQKLMDELYGIHGTRKMLFQAEKSAELKELAAEENPFRPLEDDKGLQNSSAILMLATLGDYRLLGSLWQAGYDVISDGVSTLATKVSGLWKSQMPEQSFFKAGTDIVEETARQIANEGEDYLVSKMTLRERRAYLRSPEKGSRFLGQAVHNSTASKLEQQFGDRFDYRRVGPDFIDNVTGEIIELTTPGEVMNHLERYNGADNIATYTLPKLRV